MTPEEWERCDDPGKMLGVLREVARDRALREQFIPGDTGRVGDRQVRLFAAACCRQLWPVLTDPRSRAGVEGAERCGEDAATAEAMQALHRAAGEAATGAPDLYDGPNDDHKAAAQPWLDTGADRGGAARWKAALAGQYAAHAAYCAAATAGYACRAWRGEVKDCGGAWTCGMKTADWAAEAAAVWSGKVDAALVARWLVEESKEAAEAFIAARRSAKAIQADLLRDIAGSPFRPPPVLAPAVLACNGDAARRLAEVIYEGRCFNELPVLADLLEENGCTDADLLGHLRGPGPHTLGCWALDLILARDQDQRTRNFADGGRDLGS
jgi:hypothetical protein